MRTVKTLIRLGGCPGWSESSLGTHATLLVLSRVVSHVYMHRWGSVYRFVHQIMSKCIVLRFVCVEKEYTFFICVFLFMHCSFLSPIKAIIIVAIYIYGPFFDVWIFIMNLPNFQKVGGAYFFWLVWECVCLFVVTLFMPPVTFEPCMLGSWNFIYGILMEIKELQALHDTPRLCLFLLSRMFRHEVWYWCIRFSNGPRQANLLLIAYASSEGSGEPAHPRSLARTSAARSYKQWVKRNLQTESQIPGPSEWLGMRS